MKKNEVLSLPDTISNEIFFIKKGILENHAYKTEGGGIRILRKDGRIQDVAEASDNYNLAALKETVTKYYMIYWEK